jgi:hypothetical protein
MQAKLATGPVVYRLGSWHYASRRKLALQVIKTCQRLVALTRAAKITLAQLDEALLHFGLTRVHDTVLARSTVKR